MAQTPSHAAPMLAKRMFHMKHAPIHELPPLPGPRSSKSNTLESMTCMGIKSAISDTEAADWPFIRTSDAPSRLLVMPIGRALPSASGIASLNTLSSLDSCRITG